MACEVVGRSRRQVFATPYPRDHHALNNVVVGQRSLGVAVSQMMLMAERDDVLGLVVVTSGSEDVVRVGGNRQSLQYIETPLTSVLITFECRPCRWTARGFTLLVYGHNKPFAPPRSP